MMENDCICACATGIPSANSGIAIIRLSGKDCYSVFGKLLKSNDISDNFKANSICFLELYSKDKSIIDQCLVSFFKTPKSYTGEDLIEISCHASKYIIESILSELIANGARLAKAGEFSQRAFLNGKMDLSQAEAVADLIASENKASHSLAIKQLKGSLSNEVSALRQKLLDMASLVELELDFAEEDVEFASRNQLLELLLEIENKASRLRNSFEKGQLIKDGVKIAIVGRPNAGKSTLLNAIIGENRAIVSDIEGTTRDYIEETCNIGGVKFRFVDTAGLRQSQDVLEQESMRRSLGQLNDAHICLMLFDSSVCNAKEALDEVRAYVRAAEAGTTAGTNAEEAEEAEAAGAAKEWGAAAAAEAAKDGGRAAGEAPAENAAGAAAETGTEDGAAGGGRATAKIILVANKCDLKQGENKHFGGIGSENTKSWGAIKSAIKSANNGSSDGSSDGSDLLYISAKNGIGIEELKAKLIETADLNIGENELILSNIRHYKIMSEVLENIKSVRNAIHSGFGGELLALELRKSLDALGEICGEILPGDILGNIFGKFCIGK